MQNFTPLKIILIAFQLPFIIATRNLYIGSKQLQNFDHLLLLVFKNLLPINLINLTNLYLFLLPITKNAIKIYNKNK